MHVYIYILLDILYIVYNIFIYNIYYMENILNICMCI